MTTDAPRIRVPGDKSLTHRALLLAALASGRSRIRRPLVGADTESTARALRQLGCAVPDLRATQEALIDGRGLRGLSAPDAVIDCGNSGTTTRLLLGILAGHPFSATLDGDASLRSRPMRRVTAPLSRMGARFEEVGEPDRLPVTVHGGALHGIEHDSPHASAQVKSAVLLAALTAGVAASVSEPVLSRDHTERMLAHMGVPLTRRTLPDGRAQVAVNPTAQLDAFEFDVPGDLSSAAFMIAAACLSGGTVRIEGVGLNPTRTGVLDVLRRMGVSVEVEAARESCGEPLGDVVVRSSALAATHIGAAEVPSLVDEIPVIAMLAARAEGTTVITGAGELRVKESDRIHALVSNLTAVGVAAEELPDGLVIHGSAQAPRGAVQALHDHRIAMAFGVLGTVPGADIRIDDRDVVEVSFPGFWDDLRTLAPARP